MALVVFREEVKRMARTEVKAPPGGRHKPTRRGRAWCPYCGREMPFGWNETLCYARCMGCGISERDFYVRQFNGLWQDGALSAFLRAVRASGRKHPGVTCRVVAAPLVRAAGEGFKLCERCGKEVIPLTSNARKYCPECAAEARREAQRELMRKRRGQQEQPQPEL